jgi:16S rRNA (guanine527-N7)-methyltransferase
VETSRIADLLQPFQDAAIHSATRLPLTQRHLTDISTYIDLLLRWNTRINLTAIRDAESIVTRHFGESLFAARIANTWPAHHLVDIGSGAGFPGLPIKIWMPEVHVTLIESNQKKATFLREVIRALGLAGIEVFAKRAEDFPAASADLVTLRAVERFAAVLPIATRLLASGGRLLLLIGRDQVPLATTMPGYAWEQPIQIPGSSNRIVLTGTQSSEPNQ